jgi:TRAP-type mannitol/chloroaromatic compound transport system substrate-binding protein
MKNNRLMSIFLTFAVMIGLLFSTGFKSELQAKPIKWRVQTIYPISSPSWKGSALKVVNQINAKLKGRFEIEVFPAGTLVSSKEILNAVRRGMLPMGIGLASYSMAQAPALGVAAGLPYAFETPSQATYFYKQYGYEELIQKIMLDKLGLLFYFDRVYPAELVTKKPITTFADFKGMKLRSSGVLQKYLTSIGASAAYIGGSELYTSLSTGLVEGAHWGASAAANKMNLYDICKYHLKPALNYSATDGWMINAKAFNKLPKDIQDVITNTLELHFWERSSAYEYGEIRSLAKIQKEKGVTVNVLPKAEQLKMRKAAMKLWNKEAKTDKKYGESINMLKSYLRSLGQL